MTTWTREDRGLGIGMLVGALTIGSAAPHLLNALGGVGDWRLVMYLAAGLALLGAGIALAFVKEGPSGTCALGIGFLSGQSPVILGMVTVIWGVAVVADWAQFSAPASELADRKIVGTAWTLQTSLGFLLTLVTIRFIPTVENVVGWEWAFAFLALRPLVGIRAMLPLRQPDSVVRLANGHR